MRSLKDALRRHMEIPGPPVNFTNLQQRFQSAPANSFDALLIKMGPFKAQRDAFLFKNGQGGGWAISDSDAPAVRERLSHFVDEVVTFGNSQVLDALNKLQVNINFTGIGPDINVGLPDFMITEVANGVAKQYRDIVTSAIADNIPFRFGRCGGMAFAGLDFYFAGWPVDERFGTSPPDGGPLRDYIWNRLLDSLDQNGGRFLSWTAELIYLPALSRLATAALGSAAGAAAGPIGIAVGALIGGNADIFNLGGATPVLHNTQDEWPKLKADLDMEAARPIGLIYGNSRAPWDQHQVLAIGYSDPGGVLPMLIVWDNNDGADFRTYTIDFSGSELQVTQFNSNGVPTASDEPIKGIFMEDYTFVQPPANLKLPVILS